MRIIEPHQLHQKAAKRSGRSNRRGRKAFSLVLLVLVMSGLVWQIIHAQESSPLVPPSSAAVTPVIAPEPAAPPAPPRLRIFTSAEFRDLYNVFAYPNTAEIISPPGITGNATADIRIRTIAMQRGYRLRSVPVAPLSQTAEGFPLQEKAVAPWQELKNNAAKEGINLGLVSTFRSVDEQRLIFAQRLRATGASVEAVAAGTADTQVDFVLKSTSIPGYSRHHTGYAVDFKCGNDDFNFFANTSCFAWLNKNNYENAKKSGWIPSYPPGIDNQGPDPEAWEYVWVSAQTLLEKDN